jgi:hypothetical protein
VIREAEIGSISIAVVKEALLAVGRNDVPPEPLLREPGIQAGLLQSADARVIPEKFRRAVACYRQSSGRRVLWAGRAMRESWKLWSDAPRGLAHRSAYWRPPSAFLIPTTSVVTRVSHKTSAVSNNS